MEIVVDDRGRTSLARVRTRKYGRYQVEELGDGTLILRPVVSVSPVELAALADPVVRAAVAGAKSGPLVTVRRPDGTEMTLESSDGVVTFTADQVGHYHVLPLAQLGKVDMAADLLALHSAVPRLTVGSYDAAQGPA